MRMLFLFLGGQKKREEKRGELELGRQKEETKKEKGTRPTPAQGHSF